jgi:SAM-dependent methyltransferase
MNVAQHIGDYNDLNSLGSKFRRARIQPLLDMIDNVFASRGQVSIVDVGGMEFYWNIVPKDDLLSRNVRIVLVNLPSDISPVADPRLFEAHQGDGCALPFADNAFDICHSNSVIEHVGVWRNKEAFAREVTRVAPRYFHQTPNFWFPWEPHFGAPVFHWLPEPTRLWLTSHFSLGWHKRAKDVREGMAQIEYATLLNKNMFEALFPDAEIRKEKFLGLTKSYMAIKG